ncbi:hypothetical protein JHK86_057092 [Glycine max]|nr:hypothetical protein JHK86_057092 [Glycine max]
MEQSQKLSKGTTLVEKKMNLANVNHFPLSSSTTTFDRWRYYASIQNREKEQKEKKYLIFFI